jgi:DNA-binding MarR family transcriptional regulator
VESGKGPPGIERKVRSDDAAAFLIQRTARLLRVLFLRLVQTHHTDITPEMWLVLSRLLARDGQCQNELAEATFRDRPNMSRIVSGLEERGLIRRRADDADRRRTRVQLTERGRELVMATAPVAARARDRIYADLEKEELKALRRALRKIEENTLRVLADLDAVRDGESSE